MIFYIYELIDPRDGQPFYVGKGSRNRIYAHETEAAKGRQSRKCDKIREIWAAGLIVEKRRIFHTEDEGVAYAREAARIEEISLALLTNIAPGIGKRMPQPPFVWTVAAARQRASAIARAFTLLASGNRVWVAGYDLTEALRGALRRMVNDLGRTKLALVIADHV